MKQYFEIRYFQCYFIHQHFSNNPEQTFRLLKPTKVISSIDECHGDLPGWYVNYIEKVYFVCETASNAVKKFKLKYPGLKISTIRPYGDNPPLTLVKQQIKEKIFYPMDRKSK